MKISVSILFFFLSIGIHAQTQTMKAWGWQQLDTAYLVCQYKYSQYNYVANVQTAETTRLEVGKRLSKFYSYSTFEHDSLCSAPDGKQLISQRFNEALKQSAQASRKEDQMKILLMGIPSRASEYMIYKNYPENGKMLVQDAASHEYYKYIEDDIQKMQSWEIAEDTMTIIGYSCQKATCKWRGRKYTAWFTLDIPVSDGPYKFCGLPGLIMKVEDSKQLYCFEIQGIRKTDNEGIFLAEPREENVGGYKDADRKEIIAKQAKSLKNVVRKLNRDMQQLGKSERISEDVVDAMERDYK